jgi:hypothetical protein
MITGIRITLCLFLFLIAGSRAFAPTIPRHESSMKLGAATSSDPVLSPPEEKVYGILKEINSSALRFRVVVVGDGVILESTNLLGPTMKLSQSPTTGANLVTFASENQSFELHLMTAQVSKIVLAEKERPTGGMMRILRLLNDVGKPICSLIVADDSPEAADWYQGMTAKYGQEVQL